MRRALDIGESSGLAQFVPRRRQRNKPTKIAFEEEIAMPIILWLLGVPLTLVLVLWFLGVVRL